MLVLMRQVAVAGGTRRQGKMLNTSEQAALLQLARNAIAAALDAPRQAPDPGRLGGAMARQRAVFVTLKQSGALRGCIGTLEASEPLAVAVAGHAVAAALNDPRFPPVAPEELHGISISISVLEEPRPLQTQSRQALLESLEQGRDGLILEYQRHRATFLPQVWEQLPEPGEFLARLLEKAGLPAGYWSAELRFHRYGSFSFGEPDPRSPGT